MDRITTTGKRVTIAEGSGVVRAMGRDPLRGDWASIELDDGTTVELTEYDRTSRPIADRMTLDTDAGIGDTTGDGTT